MLKAILWKNFLLKKANFFGTLAEILLPVLFMGLLIVLKNISTVDDSPDIAYYCGQAFPWFYAASIQPSFNSQPVLECISKPLSCGAPKYFQFPIGAALYIDDMIKQLTAYAQYGNLNYLSRR